LVASHHANTAAIFGTGIRRSPRGRSKPMLTAEAAVATMLGLTDSMPAPFAPSQVDVVPVDATF
jgi:hypothetical protein